MTEPTPPSSWPASRWETAGHETRTNSGNMLHPIQVQPEASRFRALYGAESVLVHQLQYQDIARYLYLLLVPGSQKKSPLECRTLQVAGTPRYFWNRETKYTSRFEARPSVIANRNVIEQFLVCDFFSAPHCTNMFNFYSKCVLDVLIQLFFKLNHRRKICWNRISRPYIRSNNAVQRPS